MDCMNSKPLNEWLQATLPDRKTRFEWIANIADAIHHAHRKGVIHRDLKPHNGLVETDGHPKIVDFGIARVAERDGASNQQTQAGWDPQHPVLHGSRTSRGRPRRRGCSSGDVVPGCASLRSAFRLVAFGFRRPKHRHRDTDDPQDLPSDPPQHGPKPSIFCGLPPQAIRARGPHRLLETPILVLRRLRALKDYRQMDHQSSCGKISTCSPRVDLPRHVHKALQIKRLRPRRGSKPAYGPKTRS
jgi:serine/threonine protein kinase